MEVLSENLIISISEKCSSSWKLEAFKDHIIINLPDDTGEDFRSVYNKVKREITACVGLYFPDRRSDALFEVRSGSWNCSFKIGKTEMSGLSHSLA